MCRELRELNLSCCYSSSVLHRFGVLDDSSLILNSSAMLPRLAHLWSVHVNYSGHVDDDCLERIAHVSSRIVSLNLIGCVYITPHGIAAAASKLKGLLELDVDVLVTVVAEAPA